MKKVIEKCLLLLSTLLLFQICLSKKSPTPTPTPTTCIQSEREALLRFKKSFHDPSGRLASWSYNNNASNCCLWVGIACNQTTGHVTKIDLRNNYYEFQVDYSPSTTLLYSNSVDSSLFEFKYLNYLDLSLNHFNFSQIPNFLGSMLELRYLNLSQAYFSGIVTPHLGNLTQLVFLDLSYNDHYYFYDKPMNLRIDDIEWISHLSSLQYLDLSGIDFSNASSMTQMLNSLPSLLSSLSLRSCNLQNINLFLDSLNSSLVTRIQLLDLSSNNFKGPIIPKSFQNMTSLKFLYLSDNHFTAMEGELLSLIGNKCLLRVLNLRDTTIDGDYLFGSYENYEFMGCNRYDLQVLDLSLSNVKDKIPDWLSKFKNLRSLSLGGNSIYGPIPASLGNLSSLEYLYLRGNALTGAIPTSLGRLSNLRELYLGANRLEEVGDECFIQLENLEDLDISYNLFKGVVSEATFANLSKLHTLSFGYNEHLLFDMKSNWVPPFQLQYMDGRSCIGCFGSEFPHWLRTQKALVGLDLSNMSISSALPTWLTGQNLTKLVLSQNQIVGPLPSGIGDQMPNLNELYLNNNLIHHSLPTSVCKLNHLKALDLSNNRLSGILQSCLFTSSLLFLDLSFNNFSGKFPFSHGNNLSNIQHLYLENNNFVGSMPVVLKNSKFLKVLDLKGNKFHGNIPMWVGHNLKNLIILILRDNLFNGSIPSSLCNLIHLQILDLAHNQLHGSIPSNLNNFQVMKEKISFFDGSFYDNLTHIDVEYFRKRFGQSIKSSYFNYSSFEIKLKNIDLSKNYLIGFIPNEISMLKGLIGLNLSYNNLNGTIPTKIGEMESLESLDLSFNQLSGPIPISISKLDSLGALELSHNNLSGDIPREGHLSTFNEATSFDGNPYLCGEPLPVKCSPIERSPFEPQFEIENDDDDKWDKWILYIMIILGYIIGFWVVVGSLILKRSWRYAYFNFLDDTQFKLHVAMWRTHQKLKQIFNHFGNGAS